MGSFLPARWSANHFFFLPAFWALKPPCLPREMCQCLDFLFCFVFLKSVPFNSLPTELTLSFFQLHVLQVDQKQQFVKLHSPPTHTQSPQFSASSNTYKIIKQNNRHIFSTNDRAACSDAFPLGGSRCFWKKKRRGTFSGLKALPVQRQADFDMVKWKCFASLPAWSGHG